MLKDFSKNFIAKQFVENSNGRFLSSMEDVWAALKKGQYVIGFDATFTCENGNNVHFSLENAFHYQNKTLKSFVFTAGETIPPHKIYLHQTFTGNEDFIKFIWNDWLENNFDCFMVCDQLLDLKNSKLTTKGAKR